MRMSKLIGERTKTTPSDAVIKSHKLLLRAGFIKLVANGIWTLAPPAQRISEKIKNIIREEMDAIEGQECLFPVVMPRELWEESGRYSDIKDEMVRLKDRNNRDLVLGMTHEEAAVHFVRDSVKSYNQLPFMIYQIQTKFRDEARSRGGLIRVREFTMKDAYSFHETQSCLEEYYARVYEAYNRIFKRIGLKNFIVVQSDSGMMGGSIAHEYMELTDIGEDSIVLCSNCDYKANMEVAECVKEKPQETKMLGLKEVYTGNAKEIKEVVDFFGDITQKDMLKAVVYNIKGDVEKNIVCFIRGDLEINESKLKVVTNANIVPASLNDSNLIAGNIGPVGLKASEKLEIIYDQSVEGLLNVVVGANKEGYHIANACYGRDFMPTKIYDISKVKDGDKCIRCGSKLYVKKGIEIGNIFQLGTKYTKSMGMTVLNNEGKEITPIMGCYGIGVGRAIAAVAEEYADEKGLLWPKEIAPWLVYICAIRYDNENVMMKSEELYDILTREGIDVLLDDRIASAGFKFADCDLMGIPVRIVISPRSLEKGMVEIQSRDGVLKEEIDFYKCIELIKTYKAN
ncbi:MAG: proline--tRNA ligase [Clostridiales bacterium]|nr:proline--tRNA ligase [Clostridiales bacterium]